MSDLEIDPYAVLRLPQDADAELIRKTYLEAVKQSPPDKDPDKFRQISAAYKMLQDPLVQAKAILSSLRAKPQITAMLQNAASQPLRLQPRTLLALGNPAKESQPATGAEHGA